MNKIIMVGPDLAGQGGISRVVKNLADGGLFEKFNVDYIASVSEEPVNKFKQLFKAVTRTWIKCFGDVSCVYIHTASNNSFFRKSIFLASALLFRKKIVLHVHPSYFLIFINRFYGIRKALFHTLLKSVHSFVVLTDDMAEGMKCLFPGKRVFVLRNPVDVDTLRNKSGIRRAEDRLLFLGWYNKEKGVYDLVDAMKIVNGKIPGVVLNFYGTKEVEQLRQYVSDKGLSRSVIVNGWADQEKKLHELHSSTMLILPSYTEGIPNVILEAMAAGTPIISTQAGGLKEILENDVNALIVTPGNPEELSEKIMMLMKDEYLRKRLSDCAFKDALLKYDTTIIMNQFCEIMQELENH